MENSERAAELNRTRACNKHEWQVHSKYLAYFNENLITCPVCGMAAEREAALSKAETSGLSEDWIAAESACNEYADYVEAYKGNLAPEQRERFGAYQIAALLAQLARRSARPVEGENSEIQLSDLSGTDNSPNDHGGGVYPLRITG